MNKLEMEALYPTIQMLSLKYRDIDTWPPIKILQTIHEEMVFNQHCIADLHDKKENCEEAVTSGIMENRFLIDRLRKQRNAAIKDNKRLREKLRDCESLKV